MGRDLGPGASAGRRGGCRAGGGKPSVRPEAPRHSSSQGGKARAMDACMARSVRTLTYYIPRGATPEQERNEGGRRRRR